VQFKSVRQRRTPQLFNIHYSFAGAACAAGQAQIRIAPTVSGSFPVSAAISIPGKRNKCIGTALIRY
jgi:hypothetical protein